MLLFPIEGPTVSQEYAMCEYDKKNVFRKKSVVLSFPCGVSFRRRTGTHINSSRLSRLILINVVIVIDTCRIYRFHQSNKKNVS